MKMTIRILRFLNIFGLSFINNLSTNTLFLLIKPENNENPDGDKIKYLLLVSSLKCCSQLSKSPSFKFTFFSLPNSSTHE